MRAELGFPDILRVSDHADLRLCTAGPATYNALTI